jgi:hypothetical protein
MWSYSESRIRETDELVIIRFELGLLQFHFAGVQLFDNIVNIAIHCRGQI